MKANLKKAMMATAVFGMLAGPYLTGAAQAACYFNSCNPRNTVATSTNQTELNSIYSTTRGHTLDTQATQLQYGDIKVGNFANNARFGNGPSVRVGRDSNGDIMAVQSNALGIVDSNIGHTQVIAPSASGDVSSTVSASNGASSRSTIPVIAGDRDSISFRK